MNATVAQLTVRTLLGRRRALLLLALPVVLLALSLIVRLTVDADSREDVTVGLLGAFALATLVPLLGLIAGTGAIGPEIDDGSIVYLLAKPLNRHSIVVTKLLVAIAVVSPFGAVAGVRRRPGARRHGATGCGSATASARSSPASPTARCSCCSRSSPATRSSSACIYALVWESVVGSFVPGAQALSIQQWSLAITRVVVGDRAEALGITAAVRPQIGDRRCSSS